MITGYLAASFDDRGVDRRIVKVFQGSVDGIAAPIRTGFVDVISDV